VAEAQGQKHESDYLEVGRDYINTMNLKMAEGRQFDPEMEGDYTNSILITQNFAALMGGTIKKLSVKKFLLTV
jgi:hypothetical protein